MSDKNTPKDEQSDQLDRELLEGAWRQVEEARQRANEEGSSDSTRRARATALRWS